MGRKIQQTRLKSILQWRLFNFLEKNNTEALDLEDDIISRQKRR